MSWLNICSQYSTVLFIYAAIVAAATPPMLFTPEYSRYKISCMSNNILMSRVICGSSNLSSLCCAVKT